MADLPDKALPDFPSIKSLKGGIMWINAGGVDYQFPVSMLLTADNNLSDGDAGTMRDNLDVYSKEDVDTMIKNLTNGFNQSLKNITDVLNPLARFGSVMIGELVAWPLVKMPNEMFTNLGMEFIPYMSQTFDGNKYPDLAVLHPSLKLPCDMRGEFVRGWDNGRGVDSGRGLLNFQYGSLIPGDDGINAETPYTINNMNDRIDWGFDTMESGRDTSKLLVSNVNLWTDSQKGTFYPPGRDGYTGGATANTTKIYNVGLTRPRNVAWQYIVRAK